MEMTTGKALAAACMAAAQDHKTLYVLGCFGAPMTAANKTRWKTAQAYNRKAKRAAAIDAAPADTFGFDCVGLIKAMLWGWQGDASHRYGGTDYASNGVPDINADQMIKACAGVSTDFSAIEVGEVVWNTGHIGVYIGCGLAVECTPKWKDGVQITAVHNLGTRSGYNGRRWTKHGKLPYITYTDETVKTTGEECKVNIKVLKKGSKGAAVKALQTLLMGYGYSCGSAGADGSFGPATDSAVRAYQKAKKLSVDGSVGPATWGSLLGV